MKLLIPALLALTSAPAFASTSSQAAQLLAACQSPQYNVVVSQTMRGIVGIVRAAGASAADPDLKSIALAPATDPRFALSYVDRANLPSEFKFGVLQTAPRQPVQAMLERAILDDGTVLSGILMNCTYPVSR